MLGDQATDAVPIEVPSFDLKRQNAALKDELMETIWKVIAEGRFILGENVARLEQEIAALCGVRFGIGVANGSDALCLAVIACGIGPGDEVITTPFTFVATAAAIARAGARPVFCDIDPVTFNIDPSKIERLVTERTKAIIPVHLYGQAADMGPISAIANKYGLRVIEDAAQAIGGLYRGRPVGSLSDVACISFFPTKNLGAFGDGGMLVTDDDDLADRLRTLRVHGARRKYHSEVLGFNSRLDELQAAILRLKLKHLSGWIDRRRQIADAYRRGLEATPAVRSGAIVLPREAQDVRHVYHQYTVRASQRDALRAHLGARGIASGLYYPVPLHLQGVFQGLGHTQGELPDSELASSQVLSLPMFPELLEDEIVRVVGVVRVFL